jgi:HD-like signal output (HDOD) protein
VEKTFLPDAFASVLDRVARHRVLISAAEAEILGCTHAEIGRLLAQRWNLPAKLITIIEHHHAPAAAGAWAVEASIVHLADILARALSLGYGGDDKVPTLDRSGWELLKLKTSSLDAIMATMLDEFDDIGSSLR